jgi:hypothetical protein
MGRVPVSPTALRAVSRSGDGARPFHAAVADVLERALGWTPLAGPLLWACSMPASKGAYSRIDGQVIRRQADLGFVA